MKSDSMSLVEDRDFYIENGKYVFTAFYLKNRGYCCNCNCRHCPYRNENTETVINKAVLTGKEDIIIGSCREETFSKEKN
jgi:hypothetical protein